MSNMGEMVVDITELLQEGFHPEDIAHLLDISLDLVMPAYNMLHYGEFFPNEDGV